MIRKRTLVLLGSILVLLIIGNPSEEQYLNEVATDFGKLHHGMSLNTNQLTAMGESNYHGFLIASTYDYTFGNIQVSYFGFAFATFYRGSSRKEIQPSNPLKST